MQEEVERKTIAVTVSTSKITGRILAKVLGAVYNKIKKEHLKAQTPKGKQSVKKLMNHNVSTKTIPIDNETRLFDRVARKWNVDYAFRKVGPNKHVLLFKAGQADAITLAFSEYTKRFMQREQNKRPSIMEQMKKFGERARAKPLEHQQKREVVHGDR